MALKQGQGHQIYNDNVDNEQGYNFAKFERSRFNDLREKKEKSQLFFFKWRNMSDISPEYESVLFVFLSGIIIYLMSLTIPQNFNLIE